MNNRIMAMLFALVAAMFISIVPVKAEAAAHSHVDKNNDCVCDTATCGQDVHKKGIWKKDQYLHRWVCSGCNDELKAPAAHTDVSYKETKNGKNHVMTCKTCGYTETQAHNPVSGVGGCRCADCGILIDHSYEMVQGDVNHALICSVCGAAKDKAEHVWTVTDNGDGTHTKVCSVCEKTVSENCVDAATDKDCVCDTCGSAVDTNHSPVEVAGKAATCTEDGVSGHLKCQFCGQLFSKSIAGKKLTAEDVTIKALGHKAYTTWLKTADGKGHYHMCQNAGCEEKLEYAEHTPGAYGYDAVQHWATCTVCKADLEKIDHAWEYEQIDGTDTHKVNCPVCGLVGNVPRDCADENKDCYCDDCGGLMNHNKADMEYLCYAPTCTESGWWENWHCKTCDTRFNKDYDVVAEADVFRAALGHKPAKKFVHNADQHYNECENAGCEEKLNVAAHTMVMKPNDAGSHYTVCEICNRIPADTRYVAHVDNDKDCVCDDCGFEKIHKRADMTYHSSVKATCLKDGRVGHFSCNTCGGLFEGSDAAGFTPFTESTVREALGHDFAVVGTTAGGLHQMQCSRCATYEARNHFSEDGNCECDVPGCEVPAHSHKLVFVAGKDATCTENGFEAYYKYEGCGKMFDLYQNPISAEKTIAATGHKLSEQWVPGEDGKHVKKCANCDEFEAEAHVFKNGNVQCAVCGAEEGLTHVAAKAATCTTAGNVEYWTSKVTGKMYADAAGSEQLDSVAVPATGHSMSGWQDLGNGQGHEQVCMNNGCDHNLTENHNNANGCFCTECGGFKTGHAMEMVKAVAATCEKTGTQAHFKCSCGKLYDLGYNAIKAPAAIAKLSHEMSTNVKEDTKAGKHYIQCKNCTYKMYEEHAMVLSDPLKGNYHQYLCECGELEIEKHYDKNGDNKCDVCDHSMDGKTVTVEQHDSTTVITGEKDTVDNSKSWFQNWLEVLTPSNSGGSTATTEKATENAANSSAPSTNSGSSSTANKGTAANNGTANTGASASANSSTTAPAGNASSTNTNTAASQTNIIVQFINWLFGLFGF